MDLFQNIIGNFMLLREDFLGISVNIPGVSYFFLRILLVLFLFLIFYLFGEKIRKLFFKENKKFIYFVSIGLGYIIIGTGLAILGAFSLLHPYIISAYLIVVTVVALYRFPVKKIKQINYKVLVKSVVSDNNFLKWGVILFVTISFIRLSTPEIVEDGYHTDLVQIFVSSQTIMHESKEALHTIPFPKLPEMIYTIPIFFGDKEAARFIHFGFYVMIVLFLYAVVKDKKYYFASFLPLLFVTAPVVIRNSSTQYTDFFAIFPFLLSVFLIEKNISKKNAILAGIFFGAVASAKVWMVVYLPALLLYLVILNRKLVINKILTLLTVFLTGYFLVVGLWYVRAYIISGNPIFPILNTTFIKTLPVEVNPIPYLSSANYISFNSEMFMFQNLAALSPFFFLGIVSLVFAFSQKRFKFLLPPIIIFALILTFEQLMIRVAWGRYLLIWFLVSSVFISSIILYCYKHYRWYRYGFIVIFLLFFGYYFLNTLMRLPYGFGWANQNSYLTRILGRDNVSYYDFNKDFRKWITDKDLVAMYDIGNFYYADFRNIDVGYILKGKFDSIDTLKKKGVTMLLIKGGDFEWFCKRLELRDCTPEKVRLLASYPDFKKYNLYLLQY